MIDNEHVGEASLFARDAVVIGGAVATAYGTTSIYLKMYASALGIPDGMIALGLPDLIVVATLTALTMMLFALSLAVLPLLASSPRGTTVLRVVLMLICVAVAWAVGVPEGLQLLALFLLVRFVAAVARTPAPTTPDPFHQGLLSMFRRGITSGAFPLLALALVCAYVSGGARAKLRRDFFVATPIPNAAIQGQEQWLILYEQGAMAVAARYDGSSRPVLADYRVMDLAASPGWVLSRVHLDGFEVKHD